jgi:3-hydroxyacyl-[acyl-carrier-protein] dehydratase
MAPASSDSDTVVTLRVARDHPVFAGHFPGRPIVPGVMLIDEIVRAAQRATGLGQASRVRNAKFVRPVEPETDVAVSLRRSGAVVAYEARCGGDLVASGRLEFAGGRDG